MKYRIGSFIFEIRMSGEMNFPDNVALFEYTGEEDVQQVYNLYLVGQLPKVQGNLISERKDLLVLNENGREKRVIKVKGMQEPYGVYEENQDGSISCFIKEEFRELFRSDTVFLSLFALEKQMVQHSSMILHCSVLKIDDQVILFSGPSGIGKSTHADLWVRERNTRVINGDRTLLHKNEGLWMSEGWPICGSSEICHNERYPIRAVVFLDQAAENQGQRLGYFESVKQMITQITVNSWDTVFVRKIWEMVEDFTGEIPVYYYACNLEKEAVDELEKLIGE